MLLNPQPCARPDHPPHLLLAGWRNLSDGRFGIADARGLFGRRAGLLLAGRRILSIGGRSVLDERAPAEGQLLAGE